MPSVDRRLLITSSLALLASACSGTPPPVGPVGRRQDYGILMADGTRIVPPPGHDPSRRWPAVVFLPATDGTSADLYRSYAVEHARRGSYVAVLPPGSNSASDYATGARFADLVETWDERVLATLDANGERFAIDRSQVALAGFSMGGDLSWALSLVSPQAFCGAVVMGSRCGWRSDDGLGVLAFRGYRFALLRGDSEASARADGMAAARRLLDANGIAALFREVPGEHVRAPPDTFATALDFVLGETPVAALNRLSARS